MSGDPQNPAYWGEKEDDPAQHAATTKVRRLLDEHLMGQRGTEMIGRQDHESRQEMNRMSTIHPAHLDGQFDPRKAEAAMQTAAKAAAPLDFVATSKHFDSLLINAIEHLWAAGSKDGRQKMMELDKAYRYLARAMVEESQRMTFEESEHRR